MLKAKVDISKVCSVCGDKALGYNFNAVTCESCKAFFRRNALVQKNFQCPFNNQCDITTVTRRFCQKCRLDKCFSIGMCKDLIMSEQDKVLKRQKIEENRAKKRTYGHFKTCFKKMKKETVESDGSTSNSTISDGEQKEESFVSSSQDFSMIKTILNHPQAAKETETNNNSLFNNNETNCNNNRVPTSSGNAGSALDVTKDVVENVQRYKNRI